MAKKAAKSKTTKATAAAPPADASKPKKQDAPPGGWLQWRQTSSDTWLAEDPEGDKSKAGARIKMMTQKWLGKDEPNYAVYRDAKYLGSDSSLEAAQHRAQYREMSHNPEKDTVDGTADGLPKFLALTGAERAATRGTAAPRRPAREVPMPAKGAPPPKVLEPTQPAPARAAPAALRPSKIPGSAVIRVKTKENPRRPGTGQYDRYAQIVNHDGKTVKEYVDAKGHLDALTYAVSGGHVQLEGMD